VRLVALAAATGAVIVRVTARAAVVRRIVSTAGAAVGPHPLNRVEDWIAGVVMVMGIVTATGARMTVAAMRVRRLLIVRVGAS